MMTLTRRRMLSSIDARDTHRIVAVVSGLALSLVGVGLYAGASWATSLWPWPDVRMTYVFLASVLAAAIAPSLWIGITGELAVLAPGALNTLLLNLMFAAYLGARGLRSDDPKPLIAAAINLAVVPLFVSLLRRSRAIPVKDTRPMPRVVTIALWTACAMLIVVGVPLLMQVENVFPWTLTPQTSTIFGCIFLGAAGYFAYAARQPYWVFGKAPILGFLAYDLVLFSPYIDLLRRPSAGISSSYGSYGGYDDTYTTTAAGNGVNEQSLAVYLAVIGVSALFATFFLFVNPKTRLRLPTLSGFRRFTPSLSRAS
ncbi:MAG: hypothetical protein QOJ59_5259 [Thermomicrobiales bacterium]|nr:hypothetical protein [Thermomicrobiales bacterium]